MSRDIELGNVIQLPVEFKIPHGVDAEKFINKIYNSIINIAEEENIEVVSDCWTTVIEEDVEI